MRRYCELCGSEDVDENWRCSGCGSRMTRVGQKPAKRSLVPLVNPDQQRATSMLSITEEAGPNLVMIMEVKDQNKRLGALVLTCRGNPETGKMGCEGVSLFTEEDITQ